MPLRLIPPSALGPDFGDVGSGMTPDVPTMSPPPVPTFEGGETQPEPVDNGPISEPGAVPPIPTAGEPGAPPAPMMAEPPPLPPPGIAPGTFATPANAPAQTLAPFRTSSFEIGRFTGQPLRSPAAAITGSRVGSGAEGGLEPEMEELLRRFGVSRG